MKKIIRILIVTLLVICATFLTVSCSNNTDSKNDTDAATENTKVNLKEQCESNEGNWLQEYDECEFISKETCESLGGTFNECASACRHDSEAVACTMQCVLVCKFNSENEMSEHVCSDEEIASKMCTREYVPVCGDDGETYSNGCTACSSEKITKYTMGEC